MSITASTQPIGYVSDSYTGAGNWWSFDPNETTPELQWPQSVFVFDQMRKQDAQVGSVLEAVCRPVLRTPWRIDPAGARDEVVEFVAEDLGLPIVGENPEPPARTKDRFSWTEHLELALLMLPFGHSYFEVVYRVTDDGSKAHLGKLELRPARTIEQIDVARDGGLISITQYQLYGTVQKPITVDRLVAYIYKKEGANWLGRSILRQAYKNWLIKDRLLRVQAQTIERNGMGIPRYTNAENASEADKAAGLAMAKAWRSGEAAGAQIPFGAKLDLVGVEGDLPDALPAIKYHDEQIARAVLAHFLNLDNQSHGSYALGTSFMDFFTLSLQTLAQSVADVASMHIVEDLVDVNWGPEEPAPRIVFDEIGSRQAATAQSVKTLVDAGIITPDERLEESSRQQYGLPPADPETARDPKAPTPSGAPITLGSSPPSTPTERVEARGYNPSQPRDYHGRWSLVGFVSHLLGTVGEARVWYDPDDSDGPRIELAVGSAEHLGDWDRHITTPWEDRQRDDESREVDFHGEDIEDLQRSLTKAADAATSGRRYHQEHYGSDHGLLFVDSDGAMVSVSNHHLHDPEQFEDEAEEQLTEEAWQAHWATRPPSDEEDDWEPTVSDAQITARAKVLLAQAVHPSTTLTPEQTRQLAQLLTQRAQPGKEVRAAAKFDPALHPRGAEGRFRNTLDRVVNGLRRWAASGDKGDPFDWLDRRGEGFSREQLRRVARDRGLSFPPRTPEKKIRDHLLDNLRDALAGGEPGPVKRAAKKAVPRVAQRPEAPSTGALSVRAPLLAATTPAGLRTAFRAEAKRITGRDVRIDFGPEPSMQTSREHAEGVLRGLEMFPGTPPPAVGVVPRSLHSESFFGATNQGEGIRFSDEITSESGRDEYLRSIAEGRDRGFFVPGTDSPTAVAIHEFGHALDNRLNRAVRPRVERAVAEHAKRNGIAPSVAKREISGYATESTSELIAESFADVVLNGESARPLSKEIFDILRAEYGRRGFRETDLARRATTRASATGTSEVPEPRKAAPKAPDQLDLDKLRSLDDPEAIRDALDLHKVPELKDALGEAGLSKSGRKRELVDRLVEHIHGGGEKEAVPPKAVPAKKVTTYALAPGYRGPTARARHNQREEALLAVGNAGADGLGPAMGTRAEALDNLESAGYVRWDGQRWHLTDKGREYVDAHTAKEARPFPRFGEQMTEDQARARFAEIDAKRKVAETLSEALGLVHNDADEDVTRRRITALAEANGVDEKVRDALLADVGDHAKLSETVQRLAKDAGLTPVAQPGQVVPFDRKRHESIYGSPQPGEKVGVEEAGYSLTLSNGETVRLSKAKVSTYDPKLHGPAPGVAIEAPPVPPASLPVPARDQRTEVQLMWSMDDRHVELRPFSPDHDATGAGVASTAPLKGKRQPSRTGRTGQVTYQVSDGVYEATDRFGHRYLIVENGKAREASYEEAQSWTPTPTEKPIYNQPTAENPVGSYTVPLATMRPSPRNPQAPDPAVLGSGLDAVYSLDELDRVRPALSGLTFNDDQNLDNFSRARQQARAIAARWNVSEADLRELQGVLGSAGGSRSGSFEDRRRSLLETQFLGWQGAGGGAVATTAIASLLGTDNGFNTQERSFLRDVRANPAARRAVESLARTVYDNTQEWFQERGVTHVRAFRGTPGVEGDRTRPWTSWSLSPASTSPEFYLGSDIEGPEAAQYEQRDIRVRDIPVAEIFSIPPSGFGTYHEQELVVLRTPPVVKTPRKRTPGEPRPSGLPIKPSLTDFEDLADRISRLRTEVQKLEVLQDLNAGELNRLAARFPGGIGINPSGYMSERRTVLKIPTGLTLEERRRWLARALSGGVHAAAGHDITPSHDELHHWWVYGPGKKRWKTWTELYTQLAKIPAIGPVKAKPFASRWFFERYHFYSGSDLNRVKHGKPPRGERVGPG